MFPLKNNTESGKFFTFIKIPTLNLPIMNYPIFRAYSALLLFVFAACGPTPKKDSPEEQNRRDTVAAEDTSDISTNATTKNLQPYFEARGTEPFWYLQISAGGMLLTTPEDSLRLPYTVPDRAMDANVKRYSTSAGEFALQVAILQEDCTNAMSGEVSPYQVSLEWIKGNGEDQVDMEGCGQYLTDYRLNDIWVLEKMKGKEVNEADFPNGLPTLEIDSRENRFSGSGGCNRIGGTIFFEKDLLRFTQIRSTKMACPAMEQETQVLQALEAVTSYEIVDNRLILGNPSGELLVFKKVD